MNKNMFRIKDVIMELCNIQEEGGMCERNVRHTWNIGNHFRNVEIKL